MIKQDDKLPEWSYLASVEELTELKHYYRRQALHNQWMYNQVEMLIKEKENGQNEEPLF